MDILGIFFFSLFGEFTTFFPQYGTELGVRYFVPDIYVCEHIHVHVHVQVQVQVP